MILEKETPEALAGARRVDVTTLASTNDVVDYSPEALDLQVHSLLARYAISIPLARIVAEIAFSSGRPV